MKNIFNDALSAAIRNNDPESILTILMSMNYGTPSIPAQRYIDAINVGKGSDYEDDIKEEVARVLLATSTQRKYVFLRVIESAGAFGRKRLLKLVDEELAAKDYEISDILRSLKAKDIGILTTLLDNAGPKLKRAIFEESKIRKIDYEVRTFVVNYAASKKGIPSAIAEHRYKLYELINWEEQNLKEDESADSRTKLSDEAVFAILFFSDLSDGWYSTPETIPTDNRGKMVLLKHLSWDYMIDREDLESWVKNEAETAENPFIRVLAIMCYAASWDFETKKLFEMMQAVGPESEIAKRYPLYSDDESDRFFSECFEVVDTFEKPILVALKNRSKNKAYVEIITELLDNFDNDEGLSKCVKRAVMKTIQSNCSKEFSKALVDNYNSLGDVDVFTNMRFYIKCMGNTIVLVEASDAFLNKSIKCYIEHHEDEAPFIARGVEGAFFVYPRVDTSFYSKDSDFGFKVIDIISTTYGVKKCFIRIGRETKEISIGDVVKLAYVDPYYGETRDDLLRFYYNLDSLHKF